MEKSTNGKGGIKAIAACVAVAAAALLPGMASASVHCPDGEAMVRDGAAWAKVRVVDQSRDRQTCLVDFENSRRGDQWVPAARLEEARDSGRRHGGWRSPVREGDVVQAMGDRGRWREATVVRVRGQHAKVRFERRGVEMWVPVASLRDGHGRALGR